MAALPDNARQSVRNDWMKQASDLKLPCNITKADLRAAVNAADDWVEANAASFNSALPQPARGALTTLQKYRILQLVLDRKTAGL